MKSKKTKVLPTKRMRGYEGLTGWMLLMASAPGKKWEAGNIVRAFDGIRAFVAMHNVNIRLAKRMSRLHPGAGRNMREGLSPSPLRLLAPGGIIAAESHTRKDKRTARRTRKPKKTVLKTTGQLRHSIHIESQNEQRSVIHPSLAAPGYSSLLDHPGYPHQTTPAKSKD